MTLTDMEREQIHAYTSVTQKPNRTFEDLIEKACRDLVGVAEPITLIQGNKVRWRVS
jgi:hypothetical protein